MNCLCKKNIFDWIRWGRIVWPTNKVGMFFAFGARNDSSEWPFLYDDHTIDKTYVQTLSFMTGFLLETL